MDWPGRNGSAGFDAASFGGVRTGPAGLAERGSEGYVSERRGAFWPDWFGGFRHLVEG